MCVRVRELREQSEGILAAMSGWGWVVWMWMEGSFGGQEGRLNFVKLVEREQGGGGRGA